MMKISVLIPVYNAELYLSQSISSVLAQSYTDFNVIILDDCSTDKSYSIAEKYADQDERITLIRNSENMGIAAARDLLLSLVQTSYFAWMDADDISFPNRFQQQVEFLEKNTGVVAVSGGYIDMTSSFIYLPETDEKLIATKMLVCNEIVNPAAMVRTCAARSTGFSFVSCGVQSATDFAFWLSLIEVGPIANLPCVLIMYRVHERQESTSNKLIQSHSAKSLVVKNMHRIGVDDAISVTDDIILYQNESPSLKTADKVGHVYKSLLSVVAEDKRYDHKYLTNLLDGYYMRYCKFFGVSGFYSYIKYFGLIKLMKKDKFGFSFLKRCFDFQRS